MKIKNMIRSFLNSVSYFVQQPEQLGFTVSGLLTFVGLASLIDVINGVMQLVVLLGSTVVSIFTIIYLHKKTKKLNETKDEE